MDAPVFSTLAVIGTGLIGSSILRAARATNAAKRTIGCVRNMEAKLALERLDIADIVHVDLQEAVKEADIVILCTPLSAYIPVMMEITSSLPPHCLISDAGSAKARAGDELMFSVPADIPVIPAHPIAGSEKSGPEAGSATLFAQKRIILTPPTSAPEDALARLTRFWERMGGQVERMDALRHDRLYAALSHLPQCLAFTAAFLGPASAEPAHPLTRFLRLSRSSPELWADILLFNRRPVMTALSAMGLAFIRLRLLLIVEQEQALKEHLARATAFYQQIYGKPEECSEDEDNETPPSEEITAPLAMATLAAAICMITVEMVLDEPESSLAHYAGTGLQDTGAPLSLPPADAVRAFIRHKKELLGWMSRIQLHLEEIEKSLMAGRLEPLTALLERLQREEVSK